MQVKLFGSSLAPLAVSSGCHHPMLTLCGVGCGTSLLIQSMSSDPATHGSYDKASEASACKTGAITSPQNRACRLALGSIYFLSAITTFSRVTGADSDSNSEPPASLCAKGLYSACAMALGSTVGLAMCMLVLMYIG